MYNYIFYSVKYVFDCFLCTEIRSWWEVPCIAHYCYLFRNAFKLPPFEIEVSNW